MFSQILFKLKIYKGVLITRMISSLVITLRLQIATAHTHTHTHTHARAHTHTNTHTQNDVRINSKKQCNSGRKTPENCLQNIP